MAWTNLGLLTFFMKLCFFLSSWANLELNIMIAKPKGENSINFMSWRQSKQQFFKIEGNLLNIDFWLQTKLRNNRFCTKKKVRARWTMTKYELCVCVYSFRSSLANKKLLLSLNTTHNVKTTSCVGVILPAIIFKTENNFRLLKIKEKSWT